ncbi:elongation factor EF-1 gamma subunit [Galdieria sulphuraria]|uniref:Elongation factor EF-1 gamma subunit n=1 Tax=Galdieria sulphuraria TaxID=130081 RepID=M2Y440_GALSU|nr:elongation factor EF-1 gamma subunit [Galdieria sulphuraria]EME30594.1 elongation factor EF-1 gamma subunit [Galdieria sulphuraria]|eukprot:XP_005707114.1 elongation factor EF-1 gamma subunit [Galdieria sulphuraria]
MHKDNDILSCRELSHFELKTVEAFFIRNNIETLHLFQPREIFLQTCNIVWCRKVENFSYRTFSSTSLYGLLFIRRILYYASAIQSYDKDVLQSALQLSYQSDVEKRAWRAYLFRYCWSGRSIVDSFFHTLVTISMEDESALVKLCSIDSLFYWVRQSGEDFCSRLLLLLKYLIPSLFIRQPKVIRYFILKHLLQLVDVFIAIPMKRQPLALHHSFLIIALKVCNDPSCLVRQLGLQLLEKLLFRPNFIILQAFLRKSIRPEKYSFISNPIITSSWDYLHSLLQKLKLNNSKGIVALEVAGSLVQLAEDSCLHIRLSFVHVIDMLLYYFKTNTRLTGHVVDCLLSLLYDSSGLIRVKALNVLTYHAQDLCLGDISLKKLLMCLLDPNPLFRYSVAFLVSNLMLCEDCNLGLIFKYYMKAFEFFQNDLPILSWSIERLGIRNPQFVRRSVLIFPQLVNKCLFKTCNSIDPVERNILYLSEQHKLLLMFKFFLSSNDEQVIESLPRAFVLLFDIRRRKYEEHRLSLSLQVCCRSEENHLVYITSQSVLSCLSFELAIFGYQCLYYERNCFQPIYFPLLKLYIQYLVTYCTSSSFEAVIHTAKCLLEWLRLCPVNTDHTSCFVSECIPIEKAKENDSRINCKCIWRSALLDTIIGLALFQSPYRYIEQLCIVLEHIYEAKIFSNLARDFYKAVEHYFVHSSVHLRSIRYYLQILSLTCSENIDVSNMILVELLCAVSVQNFELDRIPPLFIRIYSYSDTNHPLTVQQRLETCEQRLKEGRTLVSETCQLSLKADDSIRKGFVSLETVLRLTGACSNMLIKQIVTPSIHPRVSVCNALDCKILLYYESIQLLIQRDLYIFERWPSSSFSKASESILHIESSPAFWLLSCFLQMYKLYTYPNNPRAQKALIAAEYAQVSVQVPKFEMGKDNKSPEFLKLFPLGKIPALETPQGPVSESPAIAWYFAKLRPDKGLCGNSLYEECQVQQWISFAEDAFAKHYPVLLYPYFMPGNFSFQEQEAEKAKQQIKRYLDVLELHLLHNTYLVGERVTLADITAVCYIVPLFRIALGKSFRAAYTSLLRWLHTCLNKQSFQRVIGSVEFCTEPLVGQKTATASTVQEGHESTISQSSHVNGFSNELMDMNEWKRKYSNTDTRTEALPWFWEHFNPSQLSLWYCKYKYNDELEKTFMSANLVSGWFQRLESLRKSTFGSILLFGQSGPAGSVEIHGVWLFVGQDIPKDMKEGVDFDAYEFSKLDPNNAKDRTLIENFFAWDGDFSSITNKPVNQGKVFK